MTRPQRLREFYNRLRGQPPSTTAEEALGRVRNTLTEVEDAHSGVPRSHPPPPPGRPDGRMYPPLDGHVIRHPDGRLTAQARGHDIACGRDGSITFKNRISGRIEFRQPGGGK